MAIEQWGLFSVPQLLWHGPTLYHGHLRGPVIHGILYVVLTLKVRGVFNVALLTLYDVYFGKLLNTMANKRNWLTIHVSKEYDLQIKYNLVGISQSFQRPTEVEILMSFQRPTDVDNWLLNIFNQIQRWYNIVWLLGRSRLNVTACVYYLSALVEVLLVILICIIFV